MEVLDPKRIIYIDILRGLSIWMIVLLHVEQYSIFDFSHTTYVQKLILTVFLPLFFLISGFLSIKSGQDYNLNYCIEKFITKFRILIIPTIIFGVIYSIVFLDESVIEFLKSSSKYGYWFPISLFEMYFIYYLVQVLSYYLFRNYHNIPMLLLIIISVMMFISKSYFKEHESLMNLGNIGCLYDTFRYFHFFVSGVLISKFQIFDRKWFNNRYFFFIILLLFFLFFNNYEGTNRLLRSVHELFPRYLGVICIVYIFKTIRLKSFKSIQYFLQFLGVNSLSIYVLHYFFLPDLTSIASYIIRYPVCLFLISLFFSIMVILATQIIRWMMSKISIIDIVIWGRRCG